MFKSFLFTIRKFRVATALNVIGLSVAFCTLYFIVTQIVFGKTFNHSIPDYENCYRVEVKSNDLHQNWGVNLTYELYRTVSQIDCIDKASTFSSYRSRYEIMDQGKWRSIWIADMSPEWFHFVGAEVLHGTIDSLSKGKIVVTRQFAIRHFGRENIVGEQIPFRDGGITIASVVDNIDENILGADKIFRILIPENQSPTNYDLQVLVHVPNASDTTKITESLVNGFLDQFRKMPELVDEYPEGYVPNIQFRLTPLSATFYSNVETQTDYGSRMFTFLLELSALLIVIVALVNFANFTLAQAPSRIRSINIRKILGSSNISLRLSLILESVALSLLAFCLSLLWAHLMVQSGSLTQITSGPLALGDNIAIVAQLAVICIFIGLTAGIYPAWFCTSFTPALAVKGSYGLSPRGRIFRTCLILLQFASTLVIVPLVWIQQRQMTCLLEADYGFDKDNLLFVELPSSVIDRADSVRTAIEKIDGVEGVAFSQFLLGRSHGHPVMSRPHISGNNMLFSFEACSPNYPEVMGLKILKGRGCQPDDSNAVIVNETMLREHPFVELGKPLNSELPTVVGVCADIRLASMRTNDREVESLLICPITDPKGFTPLNTYTMLSKMTIRVSAESDIKSTSALIAQWFDSEFPSEDIKVSPYDLALGANYVTFSTLMAGIWIVAATLIFMTLIGSLCLTMFECEYRRKEINIRKILGGSSLQIIGLLCRRYVIILGISFLISAPIAYSLGNQWLSNFSEHIEISPLLFAVSLLAVSLIVLATVSLYALRTASENPAESLRRE